MRQLHCKVDTYNKEYLINKSELESIEAKSRSGFIRQSEENRLHHQLAQHNISKDLHHITLLDHQQVLHNVNDNYPDTLDLPKHIHNHNS